MTFRRLQPDDSELAAARMRDDGHTMSLEPETEKREEISEIRSCLVYCDQK